MRAGDIGPHMDPVEKRTDIINLGLELGDYVASSESRNANI